MFEKEEELKKNFEGLKDARNALSMLKKMLDTLQAEIDSLEETNWDAYTSKTEAYNTLLEMFQGYEKGYREAIEEYIDAYTKHHFNLW